MGRNMMENPMDESGDGTLRLGFDCDRAKTRLDNAANEAQTESMLLTFTSRARFAAAPGAKAVLFLMLSAAISAPAASQQIGDEENGRMFASDVCAQCHAVRADEKNSPLPSAPRFEDVANTPGMTAIALRVWFESPHPTMPNIIISDAQMRDVIEYILSLKRE